MFIGHVALAMAAKKAAPNVKLGTALIAAQFLDLLWPVLLLLGLEHFRIAPGDTAMTPLDFYDYPISHSLVMVLVWAVAAGAGFYLLRRDARGAGIIGLLVLSHWILDFVTHRPDLPLWPGSAFLAGMGLWNSIAGTVIVESLLFLAGIWLYLRSTPVSDRTGTSAFWLFIGVLSILYVTNMLSVPPGVTAVAVSGLGLWLFVAWAYWIDRHRSPAAA